MTATPLLQPANLEELRAALASANARREPIPGIDLRAFNRVVDARFDALNSRTAGRDLPAGRMTPPTAWGIVASGSVLFILISAAINPLAGMLSPIALLLVLGYSTTKRFTRFSHFFLGAALGLAPLGDWVAVRASLADAGPWWIALAVMLWVAGFDIIYAIQDIEFDRKQGLHSLAATLGTRRAVIVARGLHALMWLCLVAAGMALRQSPLYFAGLLLVLGALLWEDWLVRRMNQRNLEGRLLLANAAASFGYLAAVLLGLGHGL